VAGIIDVIVRPWEPLFLLTDFSLTPLAATLVFVFACLAGYQYRRVWKTEGPTWRLWLFGLAAAGALLALAFVPLRGFG
jgi:hypothetical protein